MASDVIQLAAKFVIEQAPQDFSQGRTLIFWGPCKFLRPHGLELWPQTPTWTPEAGKTMAQDLKESAKRKYLRYRQSPGTARVPSSIHSPEIRPR